MYTHGDMFGNIGGFSLAAQWAGIHTAWYMDNHPFATYIHARHFPLSCHLGNIFDYRTLPYADVITAGFPCQPFSVAGKRRGKDDPRYLVPIMMDLLMEVQPRVILFENTPGFPSLNDGAEFRGLLRTLARNGYNAEWDHLRASDFGAPHIRKRWFCVAYTNRQRRDRSGATYAGPYTQHEKWHDPLCERRGGAKLHALAPGSQDVADAAGARLPERRSRDEPAGAEEASPGLFTEPERCGVVGHAYSVRLEGERPSGEQVASARHGQEQLKGPSDDAGQRPTQSRLGRNLDGLSDWLDGLRWPAPQGARQYDWEPPRTVRDMPFRAARVERLGLAIVPQVVYPIMLSIREWLEVQDGVGAGEPAGATVARLAR